MARVNYPPTIIRRLEDAMGFQVLADGFPAEMTDDEPEEPGYEVVPRGARVVSGQPNFLIFMVDQCNGTLFGDGGPAEFLHVPHLRRLYSQGINFANTYCASPLCAPLAGVVHVRAAAPAAPGVYDNAAEFASSIPTFAHHLRRAGYETTLSRQDALCRSGPVARL